MGLVSPRAVGFARILLGHVRDSLTSQSREELARFGLRVQEAHGLSVQLWLSLSLLDDSSFLRGPFLEHVLLETPSPSSWYARTPQQWHSAAWWGAGLNSCREGQDGICWREEEGSLTM